MASSENCNLDSLQSNPYIAKESDSESKKSDDKSSANQSANQNDYGTNQNANNTSATNALSSFFNSGNSQQDFLKGAFIGAVATFILTNKDAQRAIFKGFAKISSLFEMGIEELKERYEDAKAEVDSK